MNRIFAALTLMTFSIVTMAQIKETPLLKINGKTISAEEFNYIYNKNNSAAQTPISQREYLDLFINYKLKAEEAHAMGIDTTRQYKNESTYYFEELAKPYQNDTTAQKAAEDVLKARLNEEIDASHILIRLPGNATPADTLNAYYKALRARQEIINGANFAAVAQRVSDDPSAKQNGGRLGFFTAFQMVKEFEDAAYNTPVDSLSNVFRTQFGYHFIIVHDRRPYPGEVLTAHIMKIFPRNCSQQQKDSLKASIDSVYTQILQGADFALMASLYSDDTQTAANGGMMPWISEGQLNPQFREYGRQAFALTNNGDFSKVFQTGFGWHIVKLIGKKTERTNDELNHIITNVKRQGHPVASAGFNSYAHKLLKEYNIQWNDNVKQDIIGIMMSPKPDSVKFEMINNITTPVATFDKGEKLIINDQHILSFWQPNAYPDDIFNNIATSILADYDKKALTNKYADFRYTIQEYYDGLLVFEVNKKTIWNTSNLDTTALVKLYNDNPSRYSQDSSFDGNIFFCKDEKTAAKVSKLAHHDVAKATKLADKVVNGKQTKGGQYDEYLWPNIPSKYVVVCGTYTNGETLPYDSVKTQLVTDYQQHYEAEYIKQLTDKYKPKIVGKLK